MKYCLFATIALLSSAIAYAQRPEINGLQIGVEYTEKQIFDALGGSPSKTEADTEYPDLYVYYYGGDMFYRKGANCKATDFHLPIRLK